MKEAASINMEKISENETPLCHSIGKRHVHALLMFLGMLLAYSSRVCASVAVISMTDSESSTSDFKHFDWDFKKVSIILSSHSWGLAATQIPSGYISTKFSARKLISCGMLMSGVLHSLIPLVAVYGGWTAVIICRVLFGICQSCFMPGTQTLLSKWSPPFERARMAGFVYNGCSFGTVLAMSVSGLLAESRFGWPSIFYLFGGILILWSILFFCLSADSPSEHSTISKEELIYIESSLGKSEESKDTKKSKIPWKSIMTSTPVWTLIIAMSGDAFGFNMFLSELPSYLKNVMKLDLNKSGSLSALPFVFAWLIGFPIGWITDAFLRKGFSVTTVRKISTSIAFCSPAVALILLCVLNTQNEVLIIGLFVAAVGFNTAIYSGYHVAHMEVGPNFAGILLSISNFFGNVSSFTAPLVCGSIVTDLKDPYQWNIVFFITASVYFVANIVFIIFGTSKVQSWNEINL